MSALNHIANDKHTNMDDFESEPFIRSSLEILHEEKDLDSHGHLLQLLPIIGAVWLGEFIDAVDQTILVSTYGTISSQFHSLTMGSWLLTGYNLGYCVALPIYGLLCDICSRRNLLFSAYFLFGLGSLICGTGHGVNQIVIGRIIAGLGGAGMSSLCSVIITDLLSSSDVAVLRGWTETINNIGRSLGPPLGGLLVNTLGWRWTFLGHLPLLGLCILGVAYRLPKQPSQTAECSPDIHTTARSFDWLGILAFSTTIVSLLLAIHFAGTRGAGDADANPGPSSWWLIASIAGAMLSLPFFLWVEHSWARRPLIPLDLMQGVVGRHCLVHILAYAARLAIASNIVPYMVRAHGVSDVTASLFHVLTILGMPLGVLASGYTIKKLKQYKPVIITGLAASIAVYILILLQWRRGSSILDGLYMFPAGTAAGLIFPAQFIAISANAPAGRLPTCVSMYFLCTQLGIILGVAVAAEVLRGGFAAALGRDIPEGAGKGEIIRGVLDGIRYSGGLSVGLQKVVRASFLYAFQFVPVFCILCSCAALPIIIFVKGRRIE
ncbi:putative MFS transporter [Aspergillus clavatus NRRL 1]|uniref:MFS transporter, putative n=1 Tax=Aspergillus clavatus (strain ATCC 1007 / CBS 513.65 / DSM 816 / NCTC 3887 / NRRL 1 / QM 1276 / 107) TaxID=344612 RepID=A1CFF6_ASPCL|nr:MFS transporter, putative [Aspergillus clavatus NRRL 1]EAW11605.1 MFS transporter, putative [Aspergillus clavatus NRRL 1]